MSPLCSPGLEGDFSPLLPSPQPKPPSHSHLPPLAASFSLSAPRSAFGTHGHTQTHRLSLPQASQETVSNTSKRSAQPLGTKNSPCPRKAGCIFVCRLHTLLLVLNFFHWRSSTMQASPEGGFPPAARSGAGSSPHWALGRPRVPQPLPASTERMLVRKELWGL